MKWLANADETKLVYARAHSRWTQTSVKRPNIENLCSKISLVFILAGKNFSLKASIEFLIHGLSLYLRLKRTLS